MKIRDGVSAPSPLLVYALCIALALVACSAGESSPPASVPTSASIEAPAPGQTLATFERLVQTLPNHEGSIFQAVVIDWKQAFRLAGQQWPAECAEDTLRTHGRNMSQAVRATSVPWGITMQQASGQPDALANEFGIGICEILGTARTDRMPTALVLVVETAAEAIEGAVTTDPVWSADVVSEQIGDYQVYDWGDGTDPGRASGARIIGQAGQLAVDDDIVLRTEFRDTVDDFIGAGSLADRSHVLEVLEILAAEGVAGVVLSEVSDAGQRSSAPPVRFMPWDLLGLGAGVTSTGEPSVTVVMAHPSEAAATANAARFEGLVEWSRLLDVSGARSSGVYSITTLVAAQGATITPMQAARIGFDEGLFFPESD